MKQKNQKKLFTVAELAEFGDVSTQTVRYYHQEKLLIPTIREENGYRKYDHNQIYKLIKICYLRKMNLNIKEIGRYLSHTEREQNIAMLQDHAAKIRAECEALLTIADQITKKTSYVEAEMTGLVLNQPEVVMEPERHYVTMGTEVLAARHHLFFLYQTLVQYRQVLSPEQYDISFCCLVPEEEVASLPVPCEAIPAGQFLRYYHKGSYDTVAAKILELKAQLPQYQLSDEVITLNIVDQFVENQPENFVVAIEIPIL